MPKVHFQTWLLLFCVIQVGCNPLDLEIQREEEEPTFRRAERLKREGRNDAALEAFLKITKNREAPESHLNAGLLYLEHSKDPVLAIYHFKQFLKLKPDSDKTDLVRQRIEAGKRLFIEKLPGKPYSGNYDRVDLLAIIKKLEKEKQQLQTQLTATKSELRLARRDQERPLFFVNQATAKEQIAR